MENKTNNKIIYKSNNLIESSYNLTTFQNRLIYLAMTKLEVTILEKNLSIEMVKKMINNASFDLLFISTLEYKNTFGIKGKNVYTALVEAVNSLYDTEIIYIKSDGDYGRKRWVITCEYNKDKVGVSLQFHPDIIRDLLILNAGYTKMIFEDFATKIKGKYTFRIYELCKQYLSIGHRDFYVEDLRFKLMLLDNEYAKYSDFKRMIMSSINENNKHTDIFLEYSEIEKNPKNKKVTKIRFIIKSNKKEQQISMLNQIDENMNINVINQVEILSKLVGCNLTAQQGRELLIYALNSIDKYKLSVGVNDYIKEKVEVCKIYAKTNTIDNYIGLLFKAINNNWTCEISKPDNSFSNFEGRDYTNADYEDLEKKLLGWK